MDDVGFSPCAGERDGERLRRSGGGGGPTSLSTGGRLTPKTFNSGDTCQGGSNVPELPSGRVR
jgi:hypothetical protein